MKMEVDLSKCCLTSLPTIRKDVEILWLQRNSLRELTPKIGQCLSLIHLVLSQNQLTCLPKEIGQLVNLKFLTVNDNLLTEIPPEISQLKKKLETLGLKKNRLIRVTGRNGSLE